MELNFNAITVDKVDVHTFKPSINQAQLRQVVDRNYPATNPRSNGLFNKEDYNLPTQTFQENRVTWIDVPSNITKESLEEMLKNYPNARIYRILSSSVIFTVEDKQLMNNIMNSPIDQISKLGANLLGISQSEFTNSNREEAVNAFKTIRENQQRVIHPETGEVILYSGKEQFRKLQFSTTIVDDIDLRVKEVTYSTEELPRVALNTPQTVTTPQGVTV